jgi:hypothetical protein
MNAQIPFAAVAVAGLLLVSPGGGVLAQQAPAVSTESDVLAQEAPAVSTESDAPEAIVLGTLTLGSRNHVEVWRLRCATTPPFVQVARARIRDRGGFDGRRLYFHLKRQTTGATVKTTAPDGGISGFVSVGSGGAGSVYFIEVSKDRDGAVVLGIPIPEPYTLQAECIAGGVVRPHLLALIQNR